MEKEEVSSVTPTPALCGGPFSVGEIDGIAYL